MQKRCHGSLVLWVLGFNWWVLLIRLPSAPPQEGVQGVFIPLHPLLFGLWNIYGSMKHENICPY